MKRTTSFCDNIEQWRSWPLNRPFTKQTNVLLINCSNQQKKRLLIGCKPFFQVHISFIVIIINIGHVNHILLSATSLITENSLLHWHLVVIHDQDVCFLFIRQCEHFWLHWPTIFNCMVRHFVITLFNL